MADRVLPTAKSARLPGERARLRRVVAERGLGGLANDTKWDEFVGAVRARTGWRPGYRYKCIDGPPWGWDGEWFYHLPFPLMSVEWLDVAYLQEVREHRPPPRVGVVNHSGWLVPLLNCVGLDYRVGVRVVRVFGYSPRDLALFDQ